MGEAMEEVSRRVDHAIQMGWLKARLRTDRRDLRYRGHLWLVFAPWKLIHTVGGESRVLLKRRTY